MKRVRPDPENVYAAAPQHPYRIVDFPTDIVGLFFKGLRFKDVASFSETCVHFYKTIPSNEHLWSLLFHEHFPSLPRLAPHLNWLGECQTQRQCTRNLAAGVHTFHRIPIGQIDRGQNVNNPEDADLDLGFEIGAMNHRYVQNPDHTFTIVTDKPKACSFAFDEAGNILIGYENGSVAILNPKTGENELLLVGKASPTHSDAIASLICKKGMYITATARTVIIWDANTRIATYSYRSEDDLSLITHVKFINEKLLIGIVDSDGEARILVIDPRDGKLLHFVDLWQNPTDISVCGQTFVVSLKKSVIFIVLGSNPTEYKTLYNPSIICGHTESSCLIYEQTKNVFFHHCLNDQSQTPAICLWSAEKGIPSGFIGCCWEADIPLCSWDQLSQLFNQVVAQQFDHWGLKGKNEIVNALPLNVSMDVPCAYHCGKVFYFSADKEAILCMDFTASPQTILLRLAQLIGESDKNSYAIFNFANKILERFPKPVEHEIKKNYSDLLIKLQPRKAEPSPKTVAEIIRLALEESSASIRNLRYQTEVLRTQTEVHDTERLRQAILKYLELNPK